MKISYEFDENDFLNFQSYFRGLELLGWLLIQSMVIALGFLISWIVYWMSGELHWNILTGLMVLIGCNLLLFCFLWFLAVIKLSNARKRNVFGKIDFSISHDGFHLFHHQLAKQDPNYHGHAQPWTVIKKMKESRDYFFLSLGRGKEFVVPKRAFATNTEMDEFRNQVRNSIERV